MPQNVAAVLAEALGRTGAAALPYAADFRFLVQQHLTDLVSELPSLHVKTREYTHIDGRSAQLLLAEGTVPMYYQNVKYNIPVAIWLPEQYPLAAPLAYVVPTPDMVIKPRHGFVDGSGLVHTPYVGQWQYPSSNLRDMAQDMSIHFGSDPPLFSKPKNWNAGTSTGMSAAAGGGAAAATQPQRPPQPPQPYGGSAAAAQDVFHGHNPLAQASSNSFNSQPSSASSFHTAGSGGAKPTGGGATAADIASGGFDSVWAAMMAASGSQQQQQQGAQAPAPVQPPPPPVAQPPKENPSAKLSAAFHNAAVACLNKRLHASLSAVAQQAAAQGDEQLKLQATLRQRGEQLRSEVSALQAERVALDKLSQDLASSNMQLDRWLSENERLAVAADGPDQLDPDAIIAAVDPLSQQALEVQAQDLALEDALYALDKSLNSAVIEPDAYLKQVRAVCRRQFFVRTIGNKVAAAQQEQQRSRPVGAATMHQQQQRQQHEALRSGSMGRPVVLPQGDSWANAGIMSSGRDSGW